ncbi:MAG: hypothetical protein NUW37_19400 [Planctomycetes bacterium]|nr:hypothetical protein [Planctomycetota bacterium]
MDAVVMDNKTNNFYRHIVVSIIAVLFLSTCNKNIEDDYVNSLRDRFQDAGEDSKNKRLLFIEALRRVNSPASSLLSPDKYPNGPFGTDMLNSWPEEDADLIKWLETNSGVITNIVDSSDLEKNEPVFPDAAWEEYQSPAFFRISGLRNHLFISRPTAIAVLQAELRRRLQSGSVDKAVELACASLPFSVDPMDEYGVYDICYEIRRMLSIGLSDLQGEKLGASILDTIAKYSFTSIVQFYLLEESKEFPPTFDPIVVEAGNAPPIPPSVDQLIAEYRKLIQIVERGTYSEKLSAIKAEMSKASENSSWRHYFWTSVKDKFLQIFRQHLILYATYLFLLVEINTDNVAFPPGSMADVSEIVSDKNLFSSFRDWIKIKKGNNDYSMYIIGDDGIDWEGELFGSDDDNRRFSIKPSFPPRSFAHR